MSRGRGNAFELLSAYISLEIRSRDLAAIRKSVTRITKELDRIVKKDPFQRIRKSAQQLQRSRPFTNMNKQLDASVRKSSKLAQNMSKAAAAANRIRPQPGSGGIPAIPGFGKGGVGRVAAGAGIAAAGYGAYRIGRAAVTTGFEASVDRESLQTQFEILLKSRREAEALMQALTGFAARSPFQVTELAQSARRLLAAGMGVEETVDMVQRLGQMAAATTGQIEPMTRAYSQMITLGRVNTEELNQLAEAGVPIWREVAEAVGFGADRMKDFRKVVEKGDVPVAKVNQAIIELTDSMGMFGGAIEKLNATTRGQLNQLSNQFREFSRELVELPGTRLLSVLALGGASGAIGMGRDAIAATRGDGVSPLEQARRDLESARQRGDRQAAREAEARISAETSYAAGRARAKQLSVEAKRDEARIKETQRRREEFWKNNPEFAGGAARGGGEYTPVITPTTPADLARRMQFGLGAGFRINRQPPRPEQPFGMKFLDKFNTSAIEDELKRQTKLEEAQLRAFQEWRGVQVIAGGVF